jgi:hypothetical protein
MVLTSGVNKVDRVKITRNDGWVRFETVYGEYEFFEVKERDLVTALTELGLIPEVTRHKNPPRFDTVRFSRYVIDSARVILPNGREVKGFINVQPNNARFWFDVDGAWYSGPAFGRALGSHPHRGLLEDNGVADLRKFVVEKKP